MDEQHWPETQPVIWQNEERRRSKQIRKEYFKVMGEVRVGDTFFFLIRVEEALKLSKGKSSKVVMLLNLHVA